MMTVIVPSINSIGIFGQHHYDDDIAIVISNNVINLECEDDQASEKQYKTSNFKSAMKL